MNILKNTMLLLFIASFIFAGEIVKEYDVAPGGKLEVDVKTGGEITVEGWDKNKAKIIVHFSGSKLDEDIEVDIDSKSGDVYLEVWASGNARQRLSFEIKLPNKFDIDLKTMGGEMTVSNLEGNLKGHTMGGEIDLTKLTGDVDFTTMGGDIEITDSDVDGKVHTMGGKIMLKDITGNVSGSSMGGSISYDNVKKRSGETKGEICHKYYFEYQSNNISSGL